MQVLLPQYFSSERCCSTWRGKNILCKELDTPGFCCSNLRFAHTNQKAEGKLWLTFISNQVSPSSAPLPNKKMPKHPEEIHDLHLQVQLSQQRLWEHAVSLERLPCMNTIGN